MPNLKKYLDVDVLTAAKERIKITFDNFERIYVSFSGGKDSTVMLHLVMEEAIKRKRIVGVLIIDLEAQYNHTIAHIEEMIEKYKSNIDLHWFCGELLMRNAVTNYEPRWICWDETKKDLWVREKPKKARNLSDYDFYIPKMEFEELIIIFGEWYSKNEKTAGFIGIRADESLNRFRTIAVYDKEMFNNHRWTTKVTDNSFNIYPLYDWKTQDIWKFHSINKNYCYNKVYHQMHMAGVPISQQRLCQPYGDDQRRGLWLYHILEPQTWFKLIARVNGANSGALYINDKGNINGYNKITKPDNHSWRSFCNLLLRSLPKKTRDHYIKRFKSFIKGWMSRGYSEIPDECPKILEDKHWAPSWRRMCKVLLRNDYWCKGLGQTQPKSEAYGKYLRLKNKKIENL
jgi:predicted phosphoadenosine phosphosulfate sulfurtransferase